MLEAVEGCLKSTALLLPLSPLCLCLPVSCLQRYDTPKAACHICTLCFLPPKLKIKGMGKHMFCQRAMLREKLEIPRSRLV